MYYSCFCSNPRPLQCTCCMCTSRVAAPPAAAALYHSQMQQLCAVPSLTPHGCTRLHVCCAAAPPTYPERRSVRCQQRGHQPPATHEPVRKIEGGSRWGGGGGAQEIVWARVRAGTAWQEERARMVVGARGPSWQQQVKHYLVLYCVSDGPSTTILPPYWPLVVAPWLHPLPWRAWSTWPWMRLSRISPTSSDSTSCSGTCSADAIDDSRTRVYGRTSCSRT